MSESYIAIDWGSTHLRAWLYRDQQCVDSLQLPYGVSRLAGQTAREAFDKYIEPWRKREAVPVVMAGMIGSDAGWQPVPYLPCPVSLHELSARLFEVAPQVWIVPGLKTSRNVMRGEETQLLGAMQLVPASRFVLPGTHSKWVQVTHGAVSEFSTAMTGELHHLLMNNSLIGKGLPEQREDAGAFQAGLHRGLEAPGQVFSLFEARALRVLGELPQESVSEWLSGLLIGAEVAAMRGPVESLTLVGSESLCRRYRLAFETVGMTVNELAGDAAFQQGIRSILDARR
ncbi:2-dehydro-3-deoxygalactonokinase [Lelliottia sp. V106_10]|uniref:2-dehydro-3-deoxygalactonokinase n=1 Tax=Lelliottia wanjuensis TaxID=3050585 RepID=UPI00254CE2F5|nr:MULTISPECIES: 2-dehydro-3-deoxygalactonokinase [unclassified Lelliottia]MDK9358842.1 2-dehydro-3-deoxygalactonokinase [Lelliottia sp. V106_16]MDK9373529.1 2-dehydro-3-deoxygalactonokinase [Lelliottia sp. V106_10]MDK9600430.1 2-dehydro-3-deoxygalactonokinase [Lelliottia sp. V106_5]